MNESKTENIKIAPVGIRIISTALIIFGPLFVIGLGGLGLLGGSSFILLAIPIAIGIIYWMLKFRKGNNLARSSLIILLSLSTIYFSGIIISFTHIFWAISHNISSIKIVPLLGLLFMNIKVIPFVVSLLLLVYLLFSKEVKVYFKLNKEYILQ